MIKEYLCKRKSLLIEKRDSLLKDVQQFEMQLKENDKLISVMKETISDSNFEEFTPRTVNVYQKNKIYELEEEKKILHSKTEDIMKNIDAISSELTQILDCLKEYERLVQSVE